jgi:uncharacterized protein
VRPGEHPDFFRLPPPSGTSRESTIRLDDSGVFWHDGERVEHPAIASAMHRWISRHPDNGRYILTNGYDWTYFEVEDAPYSVRSLRLENGGVTLVLSDETEESLLPETLFIGSGDALYTRVKQGTYPAKFSRHAQSQLAPLLVEGEDGAPELTLGGARHRIPLG